MEWLPLTLVCALSFATADALSKYYLSDVSETKMMLARFAMPGLLLLPVVYIFPLPPVPTVFWGYMIILVVLELCAMWLYVKAIRQSPLYLTLPYLAFTPVFSAILGFVVLNEHISAKGLVGIMLVMSGTYVLNFNKAKLTASRLWLRPFTALAYEPGSRYMLIVATIYGITSVLGKKAMSFATPLSFGAFYYVIIGITLLLVVLLARPVELSVPRTLRVPYLLIGGCMALMIMTHFIALSRVEVAYMLAVKRTSLIFGILYGIWLFNEQSKLRNIFAGSVVVAGVALILVA